METMYLVQVIGRDGKLATKLNTSSKVRAKKEAAKQKTLGWSGQIATEATEKVIEKW